MLLLPLLLFIVFAFISISAMRRAARRRFEYEEQLAREAAERGPSRGGDDGYTGSSFGASPFGGLLESLMTGAGARSYGYDPAARPGGEGSQEEPPPAGGWRSRRRSRRRPSTTTRGSRSRKRAHSAGGAGRPRSKARSARSSAAGRAATAAASSRSSRPRS